MFADSWGAARVREMRRVPIAGDRAGVAQISPQLGMIDRRKALARGEMRIVEVVFRTPNRRPCQPLRLRALEELIGGKTLDHLLEQVVAIDRRRNVIVLFELHKFFCAPHASESNL